MASLPDRSRAAVRSSCPVRAPGDGAGGGGGCGVRPRLAGQLVALVPVERAGALEDLPEPRPGAVQPDLDRREAETQDPGGLAVGELLQLAQHEHRAVVHREMLDEAPDALAHRPASDLLLA